MSKAARSDAQYIQGLERRITRLENQYLPWQITKGRYGDLVATNLDTGTRVVIAARTHEPQGQQEREP